MNYIGNNIGINNFPSELVSNEDKLTFEFGQKYASAIWREWDGKYHSRLQRINENRKYAIGEQDIKSCQKNISGEYTDLKYWQVDWEDKLNLLPILIRNYLNSVNMDEFHPIVKAIDPTAVNFRKERKDNKLKLFLAKDMIEQYAKDNNGQSLIPLDSVPQSQEQVELEEQTSEPLKIEKAESLALEYVSRKNVFNLIQKEQLRESLISNYLIASVQTDAINGISINSVKLENFIHGKTSNNYFSDCRYFGEVRKITIGQLKNIAKESGISFSDEEIRKMTMLNHSEIINKNQEVSVLFYCFKTFFEEKNVVKRVFNKKINKQTSNIKLIKENEYLKKDENDNPKIVVNNYDVWFEGIMILDYDKTIIRHRLMSNIAENKKTSEILPPYIVLKVREKSIVDEVKARINSIQELRYRMLHFRNTLKGNITELDPDMIANVTIGNDKLSPKEVLSMYFTKFIRFRKTVDEDGEPINRGANVSESDTPIPRALIQLSQEFINEIQLLNQSFGAIQYDQVSPDPSTLYDTEPYRLSNNTAMRDYTQSLQQWSIFCYQAISSRINDIMKFPIAKSKLIDAIGTDDVDVLKEFRDNRSNHFFGVYVDIVPTAEEKIKLARRLENYVLNGVLDPLDEMEISSCNNRMQQLSMLRLRILAKQKQAQMNAQNDIQNQTNANTQSAITSQEQKRITLEKEYQLKEQAAQADFNRKTFLLQKEGELTLQAEQIRSNAKLEASKWQSQFTTDLTKFKKEQDAKLRIDAINQSALNQEKLIKIRKGELDTISTDDQNKSDELDNINLKNIQ